MLKFAQGVEVIILTIHMLLIITILTIIQTLTKQNIKKTRKKENVFNVGHFSAYFIDNCWANSSENNS